MRKAIERLAEAGIGLLPLPGLDRHYVFTRGGFAALVERREAGEFGGIGSAGLLTDKGLAALLYRSGSAWFIAKGFEREAEAGEVAALRQFAADLEAALRGPRCQ